MFSERWTSWNLDKFRELSSAAFTLGRFEIGDVYWNTFGFWILNLYKDAQDLIRELREDDPATYKDLLSLGEDG